MFDILYKVKQNSIIYSSFHFKTITFLLDCSPDCSHEPKSLTWLRQPNAPLSEVIKLIEQQEIFHPKLSWLKNSLSKQRSVSLVTGYDT